MIKDMRIRVAAGLLLSVLSVLGSVQAQAASPTAVHYTCDGRQSLFIQRDRANAQVRLIDGSYELRRNASSLGEKYSSQTAALIIDGHTAVFVSEDGLLLRGCTEAESMAGDG